MEELEIIKPTCIGPTWQKNAFGMWDLPEHTLGWEIIGWCAEWLLTPDKTPWQFTPEQMRFLLWWYAVDENGEFVYRTGVLQRMKGWGKDPLVAVMCLVELVGPSRFSHWDEDGNPVGKPHPAAWVQVAAVSRDQTRNTMTLFPSLMSDRFISHYRVKDGAELIRALGGRVRIEAVTSSYRALEGGRSTFIVLNETHHWIRGNNGDKMYDTIDGNATKMDGRYLAITNAYLPGEDSVAEKMRDSYEKVQEGRAEDVGLMYDSLEAHPKAPLSGHLLPHVLAGVRGDAVWLKITAIIKSISNTTIAASRSRRMWLNQIVAEEDAIYSREMWDALRDEDCALRNGDAITLGFDGGKNDDATALVAIRISDMAVFVLGLWEKPDDYSGVDWEVPRHQVDSAVHEAFSTYDVKAFYADVALWESYISEWAMTYGEGLEVHAQGKNQIGWDMRSSIQRSTRAHERLVQTIFDAKLKHDGDLRLRRHVFNARRRNNNWGLSFQKESPDSPKKVDLYAAMMLAHEAVMDYRTNKKPVRKPKTGRGYFF